MPQNYEIYFGARRIELNSYNEGLLIEHPQQLADLLEPYLNFEATDDAVWRFERMDQGLRWFYKHFKLIEAAGGIVENDKGEVLLIQRKGLWDLPKGKMEARENTARAAIREVEEETNVSIDPQIVFFDTSYHCYPYKNKVALKPSYWYRMRCVDANFQKPQLEEGIEAIEWVKKSEVLNYLGDSFRSLNALFAHYVKQHP